MRDFLAGQMMGAMLEFARAQARRRSCSTCISDGSLASDGMIDNSRGRPRQGLVDGRQLGHGGDLHAGATTRASPVSARRSRTATANQIGYFRPNGSVETASSAVANNVALLAEAVVLNYLALHNRVGDFASVLPMNGLGSGASFDNLIAFQPIV